MATAQAARNRPSCRGVPCARRIALWLFSVHGALRRRSVNLDILVVSGLMCRLAKTGRRGGLPLLETRMLFRRRDFADRKAGCGPVLESAGIGDSVAFGGEFRRDFPGAIS